MSNEATTIKNPSASKIPSPKPSVKILKTEDNVENKNFFLRDIDMGSVKEALLKELDISKIKESLVDDVKATLLKEIDISGLKEVLVKDIVMKDLIGRKSNQNSEQAKEKPSTTTAQKINHKVVVNLPAYKYGLIDGYKKDHQEILSVYEMIIKYAKNKDYTTLPLMLSQFSKKCHEHFNDEEELYTYMKVLAGSRSEIERRVATEFGVEMKNLSLELFNILNQSKFIPVNDNTVTGFIDEFYNLGEVLKERIKKEEAILYPMYESSRHVVDIC